MGRRWKTEETDPKTQLVREICSLSCAFRSCTHRRPRSPTFIDWYLILRIDDNAGVDLVRRRYRHLALQLHPDKNKHPQAEVAFKLVSEGYACLSDEARRRAFDSERRDSACQKCCISRVLRPHDKRGPPPGNAGDEEPAEAASIIHTLKTRKILRALEELRSRIREDARVIESCLRARQAFRRGHSTTSPVFDPSDRLLYPDYPHRRTQVSREISCVHDAGRHASSYDSKIGCCESPVYDVGAGSARRCYSKFTF